MKKKLSKEKEIELEENYVEFLRKKLMSSNYASNATQEEYEKERTKYERAKFKLRVLKDE